MFHLIEIGCGVEKLSGNRENLFGPSGLDGAFDSASNPSQPVILGQPYRVESVAFFEGLSILLPGWRIGYHCSFYSARGCRLEQDKCDAHSGAEPKMPQSIM